MGDILRRCQGEGRPYLPVRPEPSTTKSARELGGRTDGRTDAGPASPPPGPSAAAALAGLAPRRPGAPHRSGECLTNRTWPRTCPPPPSTPVSERNPRAARPKCRQVRGPRVRPQPRLLGARGGRGVGHQAPARGSAAAAMIPAPALPKFAVRPAPRAASGRGWARGAGGRRRTPRLAAEGSQGARRPRAGEAFSAPFSSGFWAARRGPLPAGVGSGRAVPGAGRGGPGRAWGVGRSPGLGARAAGPPRARPGPAWPGLGGGEVPGAVAPEGAGAPGSPGRRKVCNKREFGLAPGSGGAQNATRGRLGRRARSERSWRRPGASECLRAVRGGYYSAGPASRSAQVSGA